MDLRNYINLVRKWLWLVVLCSVIAGAATFFITRQQTPIYQSAATVFINQARSTTGRADYTDIITSERVARTYAAMLQDWPTLNQAAIALGFPGGIAAMQAAHDVSVSVTPVRDTQLVQVIVQSSDPAMAADVANILPDVFMQMNRERQQERFADTRQELQTDLATAEAELETTEQALNELADTPENRNERDRLTRLVARNQTTFNNLSKSLEDLRLAEAQTTDNITLTTPAQAAAAPIRPRVLFNTLLALIVGALIGLGIAFLIEYLDDTIKTPDHVRDLTGLATLGNVIHLEGASPDQRMIAHMAPKSLGAEAYRVLRTNLQFSALDKPLTTLVCTSAMPGEGKSTTVSNLAAVMAQSDKRVILVDADLRRPSLHKLLKLPNNVGLSTALLDKGRDPAVYLQDTDMPNLRVMTTGPIPPNPAEMLNSARMHEMIEVLKSEADLVLFDTPPVLAVADTSILASQVDGTLLVVWAGKTRGELLMQAVERLQSLSIQPLGVVLNKLTQRKGGYYYSNYYYYASREGSEEAGPRAGRRRRTSRQAEQAG
ncbi:MAG: polysaccharide biosynthesis tyrosine autokinase [Anaerolineae bacterium]